MAYKRIFSNKIYWVLAAVVSAIIAYAYFGRSSSPNLEIVKVERRTITQEVSATGNVKPTQSVDLSFETSGRITSVNSGVGSFVTAGQVIASLDSSELDTQLNKAQADLASQKAALDKANVDLANYYGNVIDTVNGAYTDANDAVRIKIDALFSDDETDSPKLTFDTINSQQRIELESQRLVMRGLLNEWLPEINSVGDSSSQDSLEKVLADSKSNLKSIYDFINLMMDAAIDAVTLSASTQTAHKTSINDARAEIDSAMSAATALMQNISSQKATIASKQADMKSYEASVENIEAKISKTVLRSPISGIVTKQDAKVGQIAAANSAVASVISSGSYEIDSYIPEVDIARIKVDNDARVTLDAYGNNVVFEAILTSIDPSETVIEGVSTYLTKLHFKKSDSRIKPGMTANIDIVSARHENVLGVPQRAVQKKSGKDFVFLYNDSPNAASSTAEKSVTTGLRGSDGYVEITEGLSENDQIVIPRPGS